MPHRPASSDGRTAIFLSSNPIGLRYRLSQCARRYCAPQPCYRRLRFGCRSYRLLPPKDGAAWVLSDREFPNNSIAALSGAATIRQSRDRGTGERSGNCRIDSIRAKPRYGNISNRRKDDDEGERGEEVLAERLRRMPVERGEVGRALIMRALHSLALLAFSHALYDRFPIR
jgi:hypothetical protein